MAGDERERDTLPFFQLLPSVVTILGLCAGLTSIRLAFAERWEAAAALIIFAALIDGLDGMLARRLDAASPFGAELDSLSDFVNFGVAPAILVFHFTLEDLRGIGWVFALVYIICCCLRLARFNVSRDVPAPKGRVFFVGVPAPAGAMLALFPVFLTLADVLDASELAPLAALWLGFVGLLMVSRIRTFSLKGLRIQRDRAIWVLIGAATLVGLLASRFWLMMAVADAVYGGTLALEALRRRRGNGEKSWS